MKKYQDILSYVSILGATASIITFIFATNILDNIDTNLLIGIASSMLASLLVYAIFYIKDQASALGETRQEIESLRNSIKNLLEKYEKKTVFISYNHKDKEYAKKIANELSKANLSIWKYEDEIEVGENWKDTIDVALKEADYFLYLISKNTNSSKHLSRELELAIKSNKKILPVLLDDSNPPEFISNIKYANLNDNYFDGIEELLKSVKIDIEKASEN